MPSLAAINAERYRLDDPALISHTKHQMHNEGVCVLPQFITSSAVQSMVDECHKLAPLAHRSAPKRNPYLTQASGEGTATAVLYDSLEVLAYDHFPTASPLRQLYESDELLEFIRACLGVAKLHRYADPFGALNVSIMRDGDVLDWPFAMTDFVASSAMQASMRSPNFSRVIELACASNPCLRER